MMTRNLKLIFALILITIVAATSWASSILPFYRTPQEIVTHPWFIATLVDTYLAFFTYWLWVAYKERSAAISALWLVLIFALGNIAMAGYALITLFRLPPGATAEDFLLRRQ
ncbi:MAG: DUF1475 family protein [Nevskia sp.]